MNRKFTFLILAVIFLGATAFITFRFIIQDGKNDKQYYPLLDRKGPLANTPDWKRTHKLVQDNYVAVSSNPEDLKSALSLAAIFIKEARISGNYVYYDVAALKQVNHVLAQEPDHFEALTYKALIYLSQHHFDDGLKIAQRAQKINPYNAFIYGILVDANVETGNYAAAVAYADTMVSIRPDLSSYSRISYLREIYGDYPGAVEAMKLAVAAGVPGDDATEWARVQLGHLYEMTGKTAQAEQEYEQTLEYRKGYAPAVAGLGNIAFSQKDYPTAIGYYKQADTLALDYNFKEKLAAAYKNSNDTKSFDSLSNYVITSMSKDAADAGSDESIGHYVDRELAYVYLSVHNNKKALEHALAEYNRRPLNIDVNETLAWAYYKNGNLENAELHIQKALTTASKNPMLLCRAGLIYKAVGDKKKAAMYLSEALQNSTALEMDLKNEAGLTL